MSDTLTPEALKAMVSKIEALFRKAKDPAATEPERELFHAKAVALMAKHRIMSVNTDVQADEKPGQHLYEKVNGSYAPAVHTIVDCVARAYGCSTFYHGTGRAGDPCRYIYIFGFKADADRVRTMAKLFVADAQEKAKRHKTASPNDTIRWRKSFMKGYGSEVLKRYTEAKRLLDEEGGDAVSKGAELVFVNRETVVRQEFAKLKMRKARPTARLDAAGYRAGQEAGRTSVVGRNDLGRGNASLGSGS